LHALFLFSITRPLLLEVFPEACPPEGAQLCEKMPKRELALSFA